MKKNFFSVVVSLLFLLTTSQILGDTNLMPNPGGEKIIERQKFPNSLKVSRTTMSEFVPEGWAFYNDNGFATWGTTEEEAHSGERSVFVTFDKFVIRNEKKQNISFGICLGLGNGYTGKDAIKTQGGINYQFSFWMKGDVAQLGTRLVEWSTEKASTKSRRVRNIVAIESNSKSVNNSKVLALSSEWKKYEGNFITRGDAKRFIIQIYVDSTPEEIKQGQSFYVDDVEIREIPPEKAKYDTIPFERVWRLEELPMKIKPRGQKTIKFPMIAKKEGKRIVLKMQCRVQTKGCAGWNNNLRLWVDDKPLTEFTSLDKFRILNRPRIAAEGSYVAFTLVDNNLFTLFNDNFEDIDPRIKAARAEKYWYLIDITDLIEPLHNGSVLTLVNRGRFPKKSSGFGDVVIGACEVGYVSDKAISDKKTEPFAKRALVTGRNVKQQGYTFTLSDAGGIQIKIGEEEYFIESSFSYPNAGLNHFLCVPVSETQRGDGWETKIFSPSTNKFHISAHGQYYTLDRIVSVQAEKIKIEDTFRNLTDEALGIRVNNFLHPNAVPSQVHLRGVRGSVGEHLCGENPTVFIKQQKSGLGLVVEDDVYRVQLKMKYINNLINCYTDNFGLRAKSSYTMRWVIYPRYKSPVQKELPLKPFSETPDYWDFINQVRQDWKANFMIPGSWGGDDNGRRKVFFGGLGWFRSNGYMKSKSYLMSRDEYKSYYKSRMTNPKLKYIPSLELWELFLNEKDVNKFKDSIMTDENGNFRTCYDGWLTKELLNDGYRIYNGIFALGNNWYKKRMDQISFLLNEVGTDGIYVDCFNYLARYTYNIWDGHTVDIDPTKYTVKRKYGDLALIETPAKEALVKYVLSLGKYVVGNSAPLTRAMNNVETTRFVEMWNNYSSVCPTVHLYTPIGLGYPGYAANLGLGRGVVSAKWLLNDVRGALSQGCLYYYRSSRLQDKELYAYEVVNRMYPFTPIEIHAGWLWGEERIITTKSGVYGWHDMSAVKGYLFDKNGKKLPFPFKTKQVGNEMVTEITLETGQIAILERQ